MPFTVSLHAEPKMTHNIKYRSAFAAAALWTGTVVNNGNFSNKNLFVDNTVELGTGRLSPDMSNEQLCCNSNYIKITWDAWTVIGLITDWQYINDGNMHISYQVDAFMSALVSGVIDDIKGLCERVNIVPGYPQSNDQAEPFSCSDIMEGNPSMTAQMNASVFAIEAMDIAYPGALNPNCYQVLTVSPAIVDYCSLTPFQVNPTVPDIALHSLPSNRLSFKGADTTLSHGGIFRGTPICFDSDSGMKTFIKQILSGCGFMTVLPGDGYSIQRAVSRHQYQTYNEIGGGQTTWTYKNTSGEQMESIRFIDSDDIYAAYIIPKVFCTSEFNPKTETYQITDGLRTLGNLHWGAEGQDKIKFLNYPYTYYKGTTANGDNFTIIPQTNLRSTTTTPTYFQLFIKYFGGDSPRLMGLIGLGTSETASPYTSGQANDWFTIRNYPCIPVSPDMSQNAQVQKDIGNVRQLQAVKANAVMNNRLSKSVSSGYYDSVEGRGYDTEHLGAGSAFAYSFGNVVGKIPGLDKGGLFKNKTGAEVDTAANTMLANATIDGASNQTMGDDFVSQLGAPAFTMYDAGSTRTERFTFSRYIEEFGQAFNCIINPLDNSGDTWYSGTITPVGDRTFYLFSHIHIDGNFPIIWKEKIKELFESGVYLID